MEQIIEKLLDECSYEKNEQRISIYSKGDRSFFLILSITEADFVQLKNKAHIRGNRQYKILLEGFQELINSGEQVTIEKNTSLVVLVKCASIQAITDLQQQVFLFEEDEYFFKKYVILYTEESIAGLTSTPLVPELRAKINNTQNFSQFVAKGFVDEIAEYLVVMQLFIKLPFVTLDLGTEGFIPLRQKMETALGAEKPIFTTLLEYQDTITNIDFSNPESETSINDLLSHFPND